MRIILLNGKYVPEDQAKISVFDRAVLMADSVYEGIAIMDGRFVDFDGHWIRLGHSTNELGILLPFTRDELLSQIRTLIHQNNCKNGLLYLQISRGVAERDFNIPQDITPSFFAFTQEKSFDGPMPMLRVAVMPDIRWGRCDIKTTQLLWASLAKTDTKNRGFDEVWFERDGLITEGSSNNAFIVDSRGIITRENSTLLLPGITRQAVLELARRENMPILETGFDVKTAQKAQEAFVTSSGRMVQAVVEIENVSVGNGQIGPITQKLSKIYLDYARQTAV